MKQVDENLFLRRIQCKQEQAFCDLFNGFYHSLVYFAARYIGQREVAEDIVQEVFADLWVSQTSYESYNSFKTFLYTAVKNACLDYLKHRNVEGKYVAYSLQNPEKGDDLDLKIMREEIYRQLLLRIEELPTRRREIFKLYLQGMKNEEIASRLGISIETVKTAKKESVHYLKTRMGNLFFLAVLLKLIHLFD